MDYFLALLTILLFYFIRIDPLIVKEMMQQVLKFHLQDTRFKYLECNSLGEIISTDIAENVKVGV